MANRELIANEAYTKMAQLCSRSEQCSADIRKKMITYDLVDEVVDEIIIKLKKERFIDDQRYVNAYISDKFRLSKWGKIKIKYYLRLKGLSDEIIQNGLDEINDEKYKTALIKTMKEKAKTLKNKDKFEKMGQIIRFAQNRGFEPELIHRYMSDVLR